MKQHKLSNRNIHIVSHTHWDREWYFSTCDSLVLMDQVFSDVIDELKSNKHVNFCLDGQISIVKEYLKLHPERYEDMKQLVNEKRLFIGPWQTQTDTQLVSAISIINNLYYGIADCQALFNDYMKVGYLPDTFGFSNQMPMIFNQFSIDNIIFWRGIDYTKQKINPYFIWEGQDGSAITAINFCKGYGMAKGLVPTETFKEKILEPIISQYEELTDSQDILIPVGNDQNNIVVDLDKKIKQLDSSLQISDFETFIEKVKPQAKDTYRGEFRMGKFSRIHKSAGGIRLSIKKSNYAAEQQLTKVLEPLNVLARKLSLGVSDNLVKEAWLLLFEGQAHDGIVGCVSDPVAEDILNRNKKALEIAKSAQNVIKKQISKAVDLQENEILIFNTDPTPFDGYKEIEVITHSSYIVVEGLESSDIVETTHYEGCKEALVETPEGNYFTKEEDYYIHKVLIKVQLPSFGYKVFTFTSVDEPTLQSSDVLKIENKQYQIVYDNNTVTLCVDGKEINDFISLHDMGNDGDTYDFSPLIEDTEMRLEMHHATVKASNNIQQMVIDCSTFIPYDLEDRISKDNLVECPCQLTLTLKQDELIQIDVTFENHVLSHRLRLRVASFTSQDSVIAATPGGSIVRTIPNEPIPSNWQQSHVEYPIDIETNSGFVGFVGEGKQLAILNKGCKEYQATNNSIYMTLFSTCGELGKPDLLYRPGRASGDTTKKGHIRIATPMAQELGKQTFSFAISFMETSESALYTVLHQFESPSVFYQLQDINLFYERIDNKIMLLEKNIQSLPKETSILEISNNILVHHIYHSLKDHQFRIRFSSFTDLNSQDIQCTEPFTISNLLEEGEETTIKAHRMYTLGGRKNETK